jgi:predicted murein hydrolase (TIGR00659 family)
VNSSLSELWVYLAATPLLGLTATLLAYQIGLMAATKSAGHPLVNPVLIAVVLIATGLVLSNVPYSHYFAGAQFVHFLLGTATVALAVPFYDRMSQLKRYWKPLACGLVAGAVASTLCTLGLVWLLNVDQIMRLSLLPKSVTAPIAMGISDSIGGIPTLSAVFCILTGIIGAASGRIIFDAIGIRSMMVRGLALGTAAHGIGTARAYYVSPEAGAFAGLALAIHGLVAAFLLPLWGG